LNNFPISDNCFTDLEKLEKHRGVANEAKNQTNAKLLKYLYFLFLGRCLHTAIGIVQ